MALPPATTIKARPLWASDRSQADAITTPMRPPTWHVEAACRQRPDLDFFAEGRTAVTVAKIACTGCPVRLTCLEWALSHHEWGVWGGTTERERRRLRKRRRAAA